MPTPTELHATSISRTKPNSVEAWLISQFTAGLDFLSQLIRSQSEIAKRMAVQWLFNDSAARTQPEPSFMDSPAGQRGLLWVDAVGGYIVCFDDKVTLGQATPDHAVELAIVGDVSRRHATLTRVGGDYILEPIAVTCVGEQVVSGPTLLSDGDEIWLGQKVHLRFRKPHPLSNTARLEMLGHHQWEPSADGALLMAETCTLGPSAQDHISCPYWGNQLVLSRTEDGVRFRADERVEIDDVAGPDQGELKWGSRLTGEDFAVKLERL